MAVLLTNHVVGTSGFGSDAAGGAGGGGMRLGGPLGVSTQYKPALGEQWRGVPHVRVQLAKGRGGTVLATLLTHSLWVRGVVSWAAALVSVLEASAPVDECVTPAQEPGHQAAIAIGDQIADVPMAAGS